MIFVGNDWAEGHHDVYLLDEGGTRLGFARLPEGLQGIGFHQMVAEHTSDAAEVVVGIETARALVHGLCGVCDQPWSRYRPSQPGRLNQTAVMQGEGVVSSGSDEC